MVDKHKRRIAVITTFSKAGWDQYASRMVDTFLKNWPASVILFVYPDEEVPLPVAPNLQTLGAPIPEKMAFIEKWKGHPEYTGYADPTKYSYRVDAVKFCHKPFALWHFATQFGVAYDGIIWLDADTITHREVPIEIVSKMAPKDFDYQYLGRSHKYTECGYLYFNMQGGGGLKLLNRWVQYYTKGIFRTQKEWHDSWLFDMARTSGLGINGNDLTAHLHRKSGGGHPMLNCFLGAYMDHLKGEVRKRTGRPRPGDLMIDHGESEYWKENEHARSRRKPRHRTVGDT